MNFYSAIGAILTFFLGGYIFLKFLDTDFGFYFIVALGCAYIAWVIWEGFIKKSKK